MSKNTELLTTKYQKIHSHSYTIIIITISHEKAMTTKGTLKNFRKIGPLLS